MFLLVRYYCTALMSIYSHRSLQIYFRGIPLDNLFLQSFICTSVPLASGTSSYKLCITQYSRQRSLPCLFCCFVKEVAGRPRECEMVDFRCPHQGMKFLLMVNCIIIVSNILVLAIPVWLFVGLSMRFALKLGLIAAFLLSGV